jgi:osomolarity two-component system sensor histidine kinase NIK1
MTTPCQPIDMGNGMLPALEGRSTPITTDNSRSFDILLAEDNDVNQQLAMKILQRHNHNVFVVGNGLEAVEAVKKRRYDVILMDVQMPVMGGFEATGKIREYERESGLQRTPIIALTAHAMLGDREKCIQAQMDEYLSKPLKQNQMMQTILKCATLGGSLLEKSKESRISSSGEMHPIHSSVPDNQNQQQRSQKQQGLPSPPRPNMETRAISTTGPIGRGSVAEPEDKDEEMIDDRVR